jgi:DNA-binding SARP family transcriptional activator
LPDADRFLAIDSTSIYWRQDGPYSLDLTDFERALAMAEEAEWNHDPQSRCTALRKAGDLYRGDLLPSCYDEWISDVRERLREAYLKALEHLVALLEAQRDYPAAIRYVQRLVQCDRLNEPAYRTLMRLYSLKGDRTAALRVFHNYASTVKRELGVEPTRAIREDYSRLRLGQNRSFVYANGGQSALRGRGGTVGSSRGGFK